MVEFVTVDNKWKWEAFAHFLHIQVLMVMTIYPPPFDCINEDLVYKMLTSKGVFILHSTYNSQVYNMHQLKDLHPLWKLIWKWNGPKKIKTFFSWPTTHNSLMTDEVRVR